jgi:outer membrane immunogenic protein
MGAIIGNGPGIGGHGGYNWQHDRFVMGIEADGTATWLRTNGGSCATILNCSADYSWLASLRGRAGVVFNDQITLLYATGGVAWTGVDYTIRNSVTGLPVGGFSEQHVGWVVGAGIEQVIQAHVTGRIEYLYYGFGDASVPAGTGSAVPATVTPSAQIVRVGVSLKF